MKTLKHSKTPVQTMNGSLRSMQSNSPPSPSDDPLDGLARVRAELKSVTEDEEDTGQFDVSKAGASAKGIPRWAMGLFGAASALALLAVAVAWAVKMLK